MKSRQERKQPVDRSLERNREFFEDEVGLGRSFDLVMKEFTTAGREAFVIGVDGFIKDAILLYIVDTLTRLSREDILPNPMDKLYRKFVTYMECELVEDIYDAADQVMAGPVAMFIDGEDRCMVIDSRTYPVRSVDEPDLERVMRGPRDGFVETLVINLALLRRRVRDFSFRAELLTVGARSQTDVAVTYIEDLADPDLVSEVKESIESIDIDALPMAERSLAEFLTRRKSRLNPFPIVRFTERPDVAAEYLFEGQIAVIVDGTPGIILLPVTLFHHLQHAEEFHESVTNGTFLRMVRYLAFLLAWLGTPLWLVLAENRHLLPDALQVIGPREPPAIMLGVQFIIGELGIELIRSGLVHTPSALATSLGIIGAVLLGELAVEVGLFNSEVVLYVTISALAFFAIPSWELSVALRLTRVALLVVATAFGPLGLLVGVLVSLLAMALTRSWGVPYLWPVLPFDWQGFLEVIHRLPITRRRRRPWILSPGDADRSSEH